MGGWRAMEETSTIALAERHVEFVHHPQSIAKEGGK